jgi:outer membrane protein assembly factor BamD (BamD/ComL family)
MKTIKLLIALSLVISVMVACGPSQTKQIKEITQLEKVIGQTFDTVKMNQLVILYDTYVSQFPDDTLTDDYLFQAANLSRVLKNGEKALKYYTLLIQKYPENEFIPECYFFRGVVYEEVMYDMGAAALCYKEFINAFPNHPLAKDAELSLQYLGKSPDEIVEMFRIEDVSDTL